MFCGIRKASSKYAFFTYFFKFQQKKKAESAGTFSFFRDGIPVFSHLWIQTEAHFIGHDGAQAFQYMGSVFGSGDEKKDTGQSHQEASSSIKREIWLSRSLLSE